MPGKKHSNICMYCLIFYLYRSKPNIISKKNPKAGFLSLSPFSLPIGLAWQAEQAGAIFLLYHNFCMVNLGFTNEILKARIAQSAHARPFLLPFPPFFT